MIEKTDKKTLKRSYKEDHTTAGIYLISNKHTDKKLLASATNAQGTLNRYRFELKFGQHRNKILQQEWDLYGETAFEFTLLACVQPDEKNINAALEKLLNEWQQKVRISDEQRY
ncbi:GIY-YIG nuclease family protein [Yersinia bercovieri]|uniref:ArsR family transcriptional regulator n=1 Tax=Yersinia bercovieri TaxID=634 RepID=A0A2G4U1P0_YERBE|nr:GIY-YIG nuclease family protein [Yersinia bercovieri]MCB5300646.1 GIY-YIG nuclease family protein [Yersinia bercovieri]MDN0103697.1 GIY-YIG nuclease family protein [Yersinia bercovieri]PHZ27231.1 ArsR family transcriptional regulator [Yersinia bercovieri]QKJ08031.1 GIY-YIG nuclease family protein [Yersinia bercovieri ATCC 43970]CFQ33405.1 Uncharacterised protein [Yersinia bercovieri]